MNWQFLDAPPDGTVMLEWQPLNHLGNRSATDGYIWGDAEAAYTVEHQGYVSWFLYKRYDLLLNVPNRLSRCISTDVVSSHVSLLQLTHGSDIV